LVDIPGLIDGRTLEEDAQTLASLKSYVQANGFPDYIIAVSSFDDKTFTPEQSPFTQLLKRIELFRTLDFGNRAVDKTVFLFTKLIKKIEAFRESLIIS